MIVMGVTGYLSNPEKAKTALMSGGLFGSLAMICGVLCWRGAKWAGQLALGLAGFLALIFTWRATVSWFAVAQGNPDKLTAAVLITLMLAASVATILRLLRREVPA